jgi:solute carrier family 25 S-adenosylmethionine transporter 26
MDAENKNPLLTDQTFDKKKTFVSFLAGGCAGISIDFALYPVDSIKTRLQASDTKIDYTKSAKDVSKYRGALSAMIASFPCAGMFWLSYEFSKYQLR